MKNARQNNCDDVVELLVKKYWSESKSELDQKIAQIAQDFINRKLFNSTVRISKQLHTEYEFVQKLIEQIIESLKQNFSHIPLATCKDKLLSIVEIEYKKLIPRTTSRLVKANLGQKGILEQYKKGITDEMGKNKEKIEIQCALLEKEKVFPKGNAEKWYQSRTIQAALITAGVLLVVSIVGWLIILYVNKSDGRSDVGTTISNEPEISGAEQKTFEGEQGAKSVYEPGAALLEIYKIDPDKKEIPELPVIRTYWKRDLAHGGGFLVPDRVSEIGKESPYLAKFSFYYEAKQSGRYGFTVVNKRDFRYTDFAFGKKGITFFKLTIGGVDVVQVSTEPAGQGVCNLKKGFHRVEFWLSAYAKERGRRSAYAGFDVKVLAPGAFDAVPITKDMILLKKE